MHRAALRVPLRQFAPQRRSFVSTVLLTKAWENETVNELRKEARKRGLSANGNKATLITRLQNDDKKAAFAPEPTPVVPQVRHASTSTESPTEVPGIPSTAEPTHPKLNLEIHIPDTYKPEPEPPVQIPFVPDLWESSKLKHESVPAEPVPSTGPKVVVIGGETTLYSSASDSPAASFEPPRKVPKTQVGKLLAGMADDLGLPTELALPSTPNAMYNVAAKTQTSGGQSKSYSRTLDADEKTGLWVLLGVFAGSWAAASYFAPVSEWAHKADAPVQEAREKTAGKKAH